MKKERLKGETSKNSESMRRGKNMIAMEMRKGTNGVLTFFSSGGNAVAILDYHYSKTGPRVLGVPFCL